MIPVQKQMRNEQKKKERKLQLLGCKATKQRGEKEEERFRGVI